MTFKRHLKIQTPFMKKIYFLYLCTALFSLQPVHAQCPTFTGMVATPIRLNGNCSISIQFAIANSTITIYHASSSVAQGTANSSGNVVIAFPCAQNPITSITSEITSPTPQICNTANIALLITLPIKLTSFNAVLGSNKTVTLKWDVEWELNNDKYDIERSADGINFTKIGTLKSNADQTTKQSYQFQDASFAAGTAAFYRLKQTDLDGKFSYSKVAYVNDKTSAAGEYSLFPNPLNSSNNTIQIKGIASNEVNFKNIQVTDMAGRNIPYQIVGANAIEINPATASGLYLVQVKGKILKLIKQ